MRRVLFGLFWFGIFWVAMMVIGGGIVGAMAGSQSTVPGENFSHGYQRGYDAGSIAGADFRRRYGTDVLVAAAALAALCTINGWLPGTKPPRR